MHDEIMWHMEPDTISEYFNQVCPRDPSQFVQQTGLISEMTYAICSASLNNSVALEQLYNQKFDLGITEYFDCCGLGLSTFLEFLKFIGIFHQIGLKNVVLTTSSLIYETVADAIGVSTLPSYIPSASLFSFYYLKISFLGVESGSTPEELSSSLLRRLKNIVAAETSRGLYGSMIRGVQSALDEHFPGNSPPIPVCCICFHEEKFEQSLAVESSFVFTNSDPYLDFPRPTLHKVIPVGGVAVPKPKSLTKV